MAATKSQENVDEKIVETKTSSPESTTTSGNDNNMKSYKSVSSTATISNNHEEEEEEDDRYVSWRLPQPKLLREKSDRATVCIVLRSVRDDGYSLEARRDPNVLLLESEMLLLRRAVTARDKFPGQLCFPGGHLEAGETSLEAGTRECMEECGLDVSPKSGNFFCVGRLNDRNIGHLVISALVFVQTNSHLESTPLQLQRSEVDSAVWVSYKLFLDQTYGGVFKPDRTDMDFYKFIPRIIRGMWQSAGFTMLNLPATMIALQVGGWRVSACDENRLVRKIKQGFGSVDREKTSPLPVRVELTRQDQQNLVGLVGATPTQTVAYELLPLFGLSLGVVNSLNIALQFNPVLAFHDIHWKHPLLFGFISTMAYSMYGTENPKWRNLFQPKRRRRRRPELKAVFAVANSPKDETNGNVISAAVVEPALEAKMTALDRTGVTVLSGTKWDATRYVLAPVKDQVANTKRLRAALNEAKIKGDKAREKSLKMALRRIHQRSSRRLQRKITKKQAQIERERRNREEDARIARRKRGGNVLEDLGFFSRRVHPNAASS